ncbi:MAG: hypothetical protein ACLS8R_05010 [Anaeromassilibacillus sp.]
MKADSIRRRAVCDRLRTSVPLPTDMKEQAQRSLPGQPAVSICCTGAYFLNELTPSCRPERTDAENREDTMRPGESVAIRYTATKMRSRTAYHPQRRASRAFAGRR